MERTCSLSLRINGKPRPTVPVYVNLYNGRRYIPVGDN